MPSPNIAMNLISPETRNISENSELSSSTYSKSKLMGLLIGPLGALIISFLPIPTGISVEGWRVVSCLFLMITWWVTEAIPMAVTSLMPLILFPMLQIAPLKATTIPYSNPAVFLYMGGFILAIAIEKWQLHMRIALNIVRITGTNANGIVGGFILATGILSMWMSNTATVVMMMPICLSVVNLLLKGSELHQEKQQNYQNFATSMMLGIAYAASIGGIATIIGTPTNAIFSSFMRETFDYEINFAKWMMIGAPYALIMLGFNWFILVKIWFPNKLGNLEGSQEIINKELKNLGPMSKGEKMVLAIFLCTALLWSLKSIVNDIIPVRLTDESIAILSALALFITPVDLKKGEFLIDWKSAEKLPWGILLLFGGGLSLAHGLEITGLVNWLGFKMANLKDLKILQIIIIVSILAVFLTEFMSNMALVTIFLPVLCSMAIAFDINPLMLTIPVTISASCAFMLPMSTPPNAIVFASGHLKVIQMIRAGSTLNIIGIIFVVLFTYKLLPAVFNIDLGSLPDWAAGR
ncbi:MAG: SLC13 family permease [Alphaproteobacteria bacterium]